METYPLHYATKHEYNIIQLPEEKEQKQNFYIIYHYMQYYEGKGVTDVSVYDPIFSSVT